VLSSGEDTKFGIEKEQLFDLIKFIVKECPQLLIRGLMTMGQVNDIDGFKVMHELK
jgi:uncharacterized pyridoxal phosphate-containing UPF0001 family protein